MPDSSLTPDQLNFTAVRLIQASKFKEALPLLLAALKDQSITHFKLANTHSNLACLYKYLGNYKSALAHIKRGITVLKNLLSKNPQDPGLRKSLADCLINLGVINSCLGRHRLGLSNNREASQLLTLQKQTIHSQVLGISLYNQGVQLLHLKQKQKAKVKFQESFNCTNEKNLTPLKIRLGQVLGQPRSVTACRSRRVTFRLRNPSMYISRKNSIEVKASTPAKDFVLKSMLQRVLQ